MTLPTFISKQGVAGLTFQHVETALVANASAGDPSGDLITEDAIIHEIILTNQGGQAAPQVIVQDRQASPKTFGFGKNIEVSTGGSAVFESNLGTPATGGLNITCDTASAVAVKIVWRRPT